MKLVSVENLKAQMHAKINMPGKSGPFMAGSFVRKANNGSVAFTVTSKVAGKTKSIYIPVDFAEEMVQWCPVGSQRENAAQNFYLIVQIAHIIRVLMLNSSTSADRQSWKNKRCDL